MLSARRHGTRCLCRAFEGLSLCASREDTKPKPGPSPGPGLSPPRAGGSAPAAEAETKGHRQAWGPFTVTFTATRADSAPQAARTRPRAHAHTRADTQGRRALRACNGQGARTRVPAPWREGPLPGKRPAGLGSHVCPLTAPGPDPQRRDPSPNGFCRPSNMPASAERLIPGRPPWGFLAPPR